MDQIKNHIHSYLKAIKIIDRIKELCNILGLLILYYLKILNHKKKI